MMTDMQTAVKDGLSQGEILDALAHATYNMVVLESAEHLEFDDLFKLHDLRTEVRHLKALLFAPAPWHSLEDVLNYLASHR